MTITQRLVSYAAATFVVAAVFFPVAAQAAHIIC
jgi:hypothetical protein